MAVVNEAHLMNFRVEKFCRDSTLVDHPRSPAAIQPSMSTRTGFASTYPTLMDGGGTTNLEQLGNHPGFRVMGAPELGYLSASSGPVRLPIRQWQQVSPASGAVCQVYYTFTIPWANLKASLGSGGGEFGYFYFALYNANETVGNEPSMELALIDSAGTQWGTTYTYQPPVELSDPQKIFRVPLNTDNFFSSWPAYDGLNLTDSKYFNLKATLTALSPGGEAKWHASWGEGEVYFSYVPPSEQESGW